MNFPFHAEKATEAAMIFLSKETTESTVLKLVKLIYLAERSSIEKRDLPIFGGSYFSMKDGPVLSEAYSLMDGEGLEKDQQFWDQIISERHGRGNTLKVKEVRVPNALSRAEIRIIEEVQEQHANRTAWEIRNWCHENIPEYEEVTSGRRPIWINSIALKVGADTERICEELNAATFFRNVFAS